VIHVVHIINMLPTPVLNDFSPYEMLYKTPPDFNQLKVFGSLCYANTLSIQEHQNVFLLVLKGEQKDIFC